MFLGAPGRCLFCKFSQKNEKVSIKSQASTCNPDILAVCFLAGQSTFHHCEAKETDRNCQRGNISWNYILSMCSLYCFTSWNEFLRMADPNKCLKATCKGSHTASLARANPACDKKHRLGSTNSPPKWLRLIGTSHFWFFMLECHSKSCADCTSWPSRMELIVPEVSPEHTFPDALPCILQRNSVMLCIDLFVLIHFVEGSLSKREHKMKLSAGKSERFRTNSRQHWHQRNH